MGISLDERRLCLTTMTASSGKQTPWTTFHLQPHRLFVGTKTFVFVHLPGHALPGLALLHASQSCQDTYTSI